MTFPQPTNAENVGAMVALGFVGAPSMEFVFSAPLRFAAGASADTAIATLANSPGDALSIFPADDRVRWDGNVLEIGSVATPSARILYYTVSRTRLGVVFSQTITIAAV